MKRLIAFAVGLVFAAGTLVPTFADAPVQTVASSTDVQKSESGVYYNVPSFFDASLYCYNDNKDLSWNDYYDIQDSASTTGDETIKLGNFSYKALFKSVYKTDLKTGKKVAVLNGVDVYDIYTSGNSLFVELDNYDVYRFDVTGKQTAFFKATKDNYFYIMGGLYLSYQSDANGRMKVSIAGEKESKVKAFGTYSTFSPVEYDGRVFFSNASNVYEIANGKAVKIGMADFFVANKTDIFYSYGAKVYHVAKNSSPKPIFTAGKDIKNLKVMGKELFVLDGVRNLRVMDYNGQNVKLIKKEVSGISLTKGKLYASYYTDNGFVGEFSGLTDAQPKVNKAVNADVNVFVMNGKRMAYLDHLGILHYRSDYKATDNWQVDLKLYSPADFESNLTTARYSKIFLSSTAITVVTEDADNNYDVSTFDLNGTKTGSYQDNYLQRMKDNATLYIEDASEVKQLDLQTGTAKSIFKRNDNNEFTVDLNGYHIVDALSGDANTVKISKGSADLYTIKNADIEFYIDENNIAFGSETEGWQVFNTLTGKLTLLMKHHTKDKFEFTEFSDMSTDNFVFIDTYASTLVKLNLKTGESKVVYTIGDSEDYGYKQSADTCLVVGDASGGVVLIDPISEEKIVTDLSYDDYNNLSVIKKGDLIYLYDDNLIVGVYNIKSREVYNFHDLEN